MQNLVTDFVRLLRPKKPLTQRWWATKERMGIGSAKRYRITIKSQLPSDPVKLSSCELIIINRTPWGKLVLPKYTIAASCVRVSRVRRTGSESSQERKSPRRRRLSEDCDTASHAGILPGMSWSIVLNPPTNDINGGLPNNACGTLYGTCEGSIPNGAGGSEEKSFPPHMSMSTGGSDSTEAPDAAMECPPSRSSQGSLSMSQSFESGSEYDGNTARKAATWEVDIYSEYVFATSNHVDMEAVISASYMPLDDADPNSVKEALEAIISIQELPIRSQNARPVAAVTQPNCCRTIPVEEGSSVLSDGLRTEGTQVKISGEGKGVSGTNPKDLGHVIVVSHGLYGSFLDVSYIKDEIERQYPNRNDIRVLAIDVNHGLTVDGVASGGARVADCLLEFIVWKEKSKENGESFFDLVNSSTDYALSPTPRHKSSVGARPTGRISFIGHSLGGLYNRYAIGLLESIGLFEHLQPTHFVTLATPHLGIGDGWRIVNYFVSQGVLGQTGKDLTLQPAGNGSGDRRRLMYAMTEPLSPFIKGLGRFLTRTTYANIVNDLAVGYYTAIILHSSFDRETYINTTRAWMDVAATHLNVALFPFSGVGGPATHSAVRKLDDGNNEAISGAPVDQGKEQLLPYYRGNRNDGEFSSTIIRTRAPPPLVHDEIITPQYYRAKFQKHVLVDDSNFPSTAAAAEASGSYPRAVSPFFKNKMDLKQVMADRLHSEFTWRKIAVCLEFDAHINICVRRRHLNRCGWPVIEHLLREHVFW